MNSYKEYVEELINKRSDKIIANSSDDLFMEVLEVVFKKSMNEVIMVINDETSMECINRTVFDAIISFLNFGGILRVFVNKRFPDGKFSIFLNRIINDEKYKKNVFYNKIGEITDTDNNVVEYVVFDNTGYRYKPNVNKSPAIFCANDVEFCSRLLKCLKTR